MGAVAPSPAADAAPTAERTPQASHTSTPLPRPAIEGQPSSTRPEEQVPSEPDTEQPDSLPVVVPPPLAATPLRAEWSAPEGLAADALKFPTDRPAEPTPQAAYAQAQRAYTAIASESRHAQGAFAEVGERAIHAMLVACNDSSERIAQHHVRWLDQLELLGQQADAEIDVAADRADADLVALHRETQVRIAATARHAYAAIDANYKTADRQISTILESLTAGHVQAFGTAIQSLESAWQKATRDLDEWCANRAKNFPTSRGSPIERAWNETIQERIPDLQKVEKEGAEPDHRGINKHKEEVLKTWSEQRDAATCGLQCEVRPTLDKYKDAIHIQGVADVSRTLAEASHELDKQTREGRRLISEMRTNAHDQIRSHQRAARGQMNGAARQTLAAIRQETQAAIDGVQAAGRSALEGYPRTVERLQDSFKRSADGGPAAMMRLVQETPAEVNRNLQAVHLKQLDMLSNNSERLRLNVLEHGDSFERGTADQVQRGAKTLEMATQAVDEHLQNASFAYRKAFAPLGKTIEQASDAWSMPLERHFAAYLEAAHSRAAASLIGILTGVPVPVPAPAAPGLMESVREGLVATGKSVVGAVGKWVGIALPDESHACKCPEPKAAKAEAGEASSETLIHEPPIGLLGQQVREQEFFGKRSHLDQLWSRQLGGIRDEVRHDVDQRAGAVAHAFESGWIFKVDQPDAVEAVRGLTALRGQALIAEYRLRHNVSLEDELDDKLSKQDRLAALAYLKGETVEGARHELRASFNMFGSPKDARVQATLRALSEDDLKKLGVADQALLDLIHQRTSGIDEKVFDALREGRFAKADALQALDKIRDARKYAKNDEVHSTLVESTAATTYGRKPISADEHRKQVVEQIGRIVAEEDGHPVPTGERGAEAATQRAVEFVTGPAKTVVWGADGPRVEMRRMTGWNADLARALMLQGEGSVDARAARLGVEFARTGGPKLVNVDQALYDERFRPASPAATQEEMAEADAARATAHADRDAVLRKLVSRVQPDLPKNARPAQLRDIAGQLFRDRFSDDPRAGNLVAGLIRDDRPSKQTMSLAMQYATRNKYSVDKDVAFRFTERMTRSEIKEMREQFHADTGKSLDAELGVYGEGGRFSRLSGDDRLRMERLLLGRPQTDRERVEVALFAIEQQRRETGRVGRWLAKGSRAEEAMNYIEQRLRDAAGPDLQFNDRGEPLFGGNFDEKGNYLGENKEELRAATDYAETSTQYYSGQVDKIANAVSAGLAIVGAIVAAAVGVFTLGATWPLVGVAVGFGLAAIAANRLIKGGRYGWKEIGFDLGLTVVSALTAGIGAKLGAAAKAAGQAVAKAESAAAAAIQTARQQLTGLARLFTGNAVVDQLIIGSITSGVSGFGQTLLSPQTWDKGILAGLEVLVEGSFRSAVGGAATSAVMGRLERIGKAGSTLGDRMQKLATNGGFTRSVLNMVKRGGMRAGISSLGGMSGHAAEIAFDVLSGHYHGDAVDALEAIGEAGEHSVVQGFGEGFAEAPATTLHERRETRRTRAAAAEVEAEPTTPTARPAEPEPVAATRALPPAEPESELVARTAVAAVTEPVQAEPTPRPGRMPLPEPVELGPPTPIRPVEAEPPVARPLRPTLTEPEPLTLVPAAAPEPQAPARVSAAVKPLDSRQQTPVRAAEVPAPLRAAPGEPAEVEREVGTAAAVRGSDFRGDVLRRNANGHYPPGGASTNEIYRSLSRLTSTEVEQPTLRIRTNSGEEVTVTVKLATDPLPPEADGMSPVARFARVSATEYEIEVSPGALNRHVERALAHELTEIRTGHVPEPPGQQVTKPAPKQDVLKPGGTPIPARPGEVPEISPHDHGRLAELGVIARQLGGTTDPAKRLVLQDDAERLVAGLGLTGPTKAAESRRLAARAVLEADARRAPEGAARHAVEFLGEAVTGAQRNPFLLRPSGLLNEDLKRVRDVLERVESIRDPQLQAQWRERLLQHTAQILVDANLARTRYGRPARSPLGLATELGVSYHELDTSDDAFVRFVRKANQDYTAGLQRSDARAPTPGFEAEYIDATGQLVPKSRAIVGRAELTPTGSNVDRRVQALQARIRQRALLEAELEAPATPTSRPKSDIKDDLALVERRINEHAMRLGEAAGRAWARGQVPPLTEIPIDQEGAGVPDLLFEKPDGRLAVVECKGGDSPLGTRLSADGRFVVQQGTIEYLQSLAGSMESASNPKVRALGERLRLELAKNPPNIEYYVVRQSYNASGPLPAPLVGQFDLRPNAPRASR